MNEEPYVPEFITIHLGAPGSDAFNTAITFPDYIKIVAACEIYPTWPDSAIRTILYLQISHALHRCITGWYRNMGYDFDITWSPVYDQTFIPGHCTFKTINRIVDEVFNSCLCLKGTREPFSFQQCDNNMKLPSHWTVVALAESGMSCEEILQNILGSDVTILSDIPVQIPLRFAFKPLNPGDTGKNVRMLQIQLNRISRNYPSIPKINPADGRFGKHTQNALRVFRKNFCQSPTKSTDDSNSTNADDTLDLAAYYRLAFLYQAAKRLTELHSLELSVHDLPHGYPGVLRIGDSGIGVRLLQVYLTAAGIFHLFCLPIRLTDSFDKPMETAVIAFQKACRLEPDGIVGEMTWLQLERMYNGIKSCCPLEGGIPLRSAHTLRQGSIGEDVRRAQQYLSSIAFTYTSLVKPPVNGLYGAKMVGAVRAFQKEFDHTVTGVIDDKTWNTMGSLYSDLTVGYEKQPEQNPGYTLTQD